MRFNSPDEVKAVAQKNAKDLIKRHFELGNDLNPYSTPGARSEFDRALNNASLFSWEKNPEWNYRWQLGRAVADLIEKRKG